jgi:peroxidase
LKGCDASVLIASRESNKAKRDAEINLSLPGDGYDVFFRAKRALELQCPGFVSCADVIAIATRDLVNLVLSQTCLETFLIQHLLDHKYRNLKEE